MSQNKTHLPHCISCHLRRNWTTETGTDGNSNYQQPRKSGIYVEWNWKWVWDESWMGMGRNWEESEK